MIITVRFTAIKFFNYRAMIRGTQKSILGFATTRHPEPSNDIMEEMQIKMLYWKEVPKETDWAAIFWKTLFGLVANLNGSKCVVTELKHNVLISNSVTLSITSCSISAISVTTPTFSYTIQRWF